MRNSLLEIRGLSTDNFQGLNLKNVNINLISGEVHAVVGLDDSGKELLMEALVGSLDVKGNIFLRGKPLDFKISVLRDNRIDYIFNEPAVIDKLTVAENMSLNNYPSFRFFPFINFFQVNKRCREALKIMNLNIDKNTRVSKLTPEKKKELSICKVFYNKPDAVIMYEPTDGLGANSIQKLYNNIYQYKSDGGSIIYITKQWQDALKVADRVSVLYKGRVFGTLSEVDASSAPDRLVNMMLGYEEKYNVNTKIVENDTKKILHSVFKATEFLSSNYELKDILKLLAKYATEFMKADGCTIRLIDENTQAIIDTYKYVTDNSISCQLKRNVITNIIKNDEVFYASIYDKNYLNLFKSVQEVKTIVAIPILIRSHVAGIMQVFYKEVYNYSEKQFIYLTTLARQVALAIEDTRLMGRSVLLQESHHRIKNNLQYIISLINLQQDFMNKNPERDINEILNTIILRIKSIASVHDLLSKDNMGRSIINIKAIINVIIEFFSTENIKMELKLEDIFISYDKASAVALIFNELISNCIEHAFLKGENGIIKIMCYKSNGTIRLMVCDNGVGLPAEFNLKNLKSLGLSIVSAIVKRQLLGEISLKSNNGTIVDISIPF